MAAAVDGQLSGGLLPPGCRDSGIAAATLLEGVETTAAPSVERLAGEGEQPAGQGLTPVSFEQPDEGDLERFKDQRSGHQGHCEQDSLPSAEVFCACRDLVKVG